MEAVRGFWLSGRIEYALLPSETRPRYVVVSCSSSHAISALLLWVGSAAAGLGEKRLEMQRLLEARGFPLGFELQRRCYLLANQPFRPSSCHLVVLDMRRHHHGNVEHPQNEAGV
jgi:hypothetical protein